jgi:hypothetical protein
MTMAERITICFAAQQIRRRRLPTPAATKWTLPFFTSDNLRSKPVLLACKAEAYDAGLL